MALQRERNKLNPVPPTSGLQNMVCGTKPEWLSQVCLAMTREVREALQPLTNSHSVSTGGNFPGSGGRSGYERDPLKLPTCYRCGQ